MYSEKQHPSPRGFFTKTPKFYGVSDRMATFITLTFAKDYHKQPLDMLFYKSVCEIMRGLVHVSKHYHLVTETTEMGVLHYHVVIEEGYNTYKLAAFIHWWTRTYGLVNKKVDGLFGYLIYIRKQTHYDAPKVYLINPMHCIITPATVLSTIRQIQYLLHTRCAKIIKPIINGIYAYVQEQALIKDKTSKKSKRSEDFRSRQPTVNDYLKLYRRNKNILSKVIHALP